MTTVSGSGVSMEAIVATNAFFIVSTDAGDITRSMLYLTSADVRSSPLWNFTPLRSLMTYVLESAECFTSQSLASPVSLERRPSGSLPITVFHIGERNDLLPDEEMIGSKLSPKNDSNPTRSVPLGAWAQAVPASIENARRSGSLRSTCEILPSPVTVILLLIHLERNVGARAVVRVPIATGPSSHLEPCNGIPIEYGADARRLGNLDHAVTTHQRLAQDAVEHDRPGLRRRLILDDENPRRRASELGVDLRGPMRADGNLEARGHAGDLEPLADAADGVHIGHQDVEGLVGDEVA